MEAERRSTAPTAEAPFWIRWMDLLQPRLGAEVVWASDEFFAPRHRLIEPAPPQWRAGVYDEQGKWMDGWETRRRRDGGHDCCIVRMCARGVVRGVDVDTSFFDGNQPVSASIEGWDGTDSPPDDARWWPLVTEAPLEPNAHHRIASLSERPLTHLRLHIFPDGGVARLRAYGEVVHDWSRSDPAALHDLASFAVGGQALYANDQHFGSMHNLLLPGHGLDMGDGWETRRRRGPGHDLVLLRLGHTGTIERAEIDTTHFKGNYPDRASLRAARLDGADRGLASLIAASETWPKLLAETRLEADRIHRFEADHRQIASLGPVNHVRLDIYPDGGVSRLRLWGRLDRASAP